MQATLTTRPNEKTRSHSSAQPAAESPLAAGQGVGVSAGMPLFLQPKLAISQPGDLAEQEADRVADQVMRMPEQSIQRQCAACEEEEAVTVSRKAEGTAAGEAPRSVHATLRSSGQPLSASTRAFFEPRFGRDLSQVRVHTDGEAQQSARDVNALAYTVGSHVVFDAGRYTPSSMEGRRLLAHELTHVVQQARAPVEQVQRLCPPPEHLGDVEPSQPCRIEDPDSLAPDYFSTPLRFCLDSDELIDEDATNIYTLRDRIPLLLLDGTRSVHIHGYASSPGSAEYNNTLACHRAVAVRELLDLPTTGAARARVILHSHGETTTFGDSPMENQRVVVSLDRPPPRDEPEVRIVGSAAPLATTSSCQPWEIAMINSHLSAARIWINDAEPLISAYANGTSSSASDSRVVEAALLAHFHTRDPSLVERISEKMSELKAAINRALDISCRDAAVCNDTPRPLGGAMSSAYDPDGPTEYTLRFRGDMSLCGLWFESPHYLLRVSTILHEVGHAIVGLGGTYWGVDHDIYEDSSAYMSLVPAIAIDAPDAYAAAIRQIYHRGSYGPNDFTMPGEASVPTSGTATP